MPDNLSEGPLECEDNFDSAAAADRLQCRNILFNKN
jgi:hypothetical protein